jgi:hypothetical protein
VFQFDYMLCHYHIPSNFWAYGSVQLQLTKWLMLFANSVWIDDYQPIVVVVSVLNSILALCFVGLAVIATWLPVIFVLLFCNSPIA